LKVKIPVKLPPGRFKLATKPLATGPNPVKKKNDRNYASAARVAANAGPEPVMNQPRPGLAQVRSPEPQPVGMIVRQKQLNRQVCGPRHNPANEAPLMGKLSAPSSQRFLGQEAK